MPVVLQATSTVADDLELEFGLGLGERREMQTLYCIGSGLNGHEDICDGGFLSLALDEIMGLIVRLYPKAPNPYTIYMNVNFKKPLPTPAVILCRAWFTKLQGRKMWVAATVGDGEGSLYATGESLFVDVKEKL